MMSVRKVWVLFVLATAQGVLAQDAKPSVESVPDAVKGITARELGGHMKFLASDLLKGRDTSSPETLLAAEYLADHVEAAGAEAMRERKRTDRPPSSSTSRSRRSRSRTKAPRSA